MSALFANNMQKISTVFLLLWHFNELGEKREPAPASPRSASHAPQAPRASTVNPVEPARSWVLPVGLVGVAIATVYFMDDQESQRLLIISNYSHSFFVNRFSV